MKLRLWLILLAVLALAALAVPPATRLLLPWAGVLRNVVFLLVR